VQKYFFRAVKFDGIVESPIYCVAAVFQKLGILHVLSRLRKTTALCILNFLLSTLRAFAAGTIGDIFYEFIKFDEFAKSRIRQVSVPPGAGLSFSLMLLPVLSYT
jgi:hypothetical protein